MKNILLLIFLTFTFRSISQGPTAQFTASPLVACVGETITFTNSSTQGSAPINQWAWDFGDGNSATNQNSTHSYATAGTYTVILVVTDQNLVADPEVKINYITINPLPLTLFSFVTNGCTLPTTVNLINSSTSGMTYAWDFDNGQTSTLQNPASISYSIANTYDISLIVTNPITGCKDTIIHPTIISDFQAAFSIADSICVGSNILMQNTSSSNSNHWSWNSGNGQNSTLQNPNFTYNTPGTFTISLTSSDTISGCNASITHQIVVVPLPTPTFTATPTTGCIPLNVTFTNTTVNGANFIWNFGDGTTNYNGQTPPIHTYITNGSFTVNLTSTGILGCIGSITLTNLIQTSPPIADFFASPFNGCTPLNVHFNNISTSSSPITDPIVSWLWTFGNGTTSNLQNPPNQIYTTGLYTVTLTVTTQNGCTDTETKTNYIQVGDITSVSFTNTPLIQCAKSSVDFTNLSVISVPFNPGEIIYNWDFGDSGSSTDSNATWSYPIDTGYFDVTLMVTFRGCVKSYTIDSAVFIKAPISLFDPAQLLYCNPSSFPVNVTVADNAIIGKATDDVKMIWKWGDPLSSTTFFEDPDLDPDDDGASSFNYNSYGTYTIEQVVYNYTTGCSDSTTKTIIISQTDASFSLSNDSICKNGSVTLTSTSTSIDGMGSYIYNLGNGLNLLTNPATYTYLTSGSYNIALTATNNVGCSDTYTFLGMDVLELPIASITPGSLTGCAPVNIVNTNTSTPQGNGYSGTPTFSNFLWTFPNGTTQITNNINAVTNYTFTTQGNFTTTLQATDGFGCVSSTSSIITSITIPTPIFTVDPVVCDLEIFNTINGSTGIAQPITYQWNIDNVANSDSTILTHSFDEINNTNTTNVSHTITLIATDANGCIDSLSRIITVSLPFANLDYTATSANQSNNNTASCPPVFETFDNQSTSFGTFNSSWVFGDGKISSLPVPSNTYVFAGTYSLNLTITDQYGCTDDTLLVDYLSIGGPITEFLITPTPEFCDQVYSFDTLNTIGVDHFVWDFGDGTTAENVTPDHSYPNQGVYYPTLTIYDNLDCAITYKVDTIFLNNQLNAFFVPSSTLAEMGDIITFDDQSVLNAAGVSWFWEYGDFNNSSTANNTDASTSFSYDLPYLYPVTLTVTDANGCHDSYQVIIHITGKVEAPNVFTPNGDGKNDIFKFPHDIFKTYDVVILNRWGQVVYEKSNITETYIWNGTKMNIEECSEGVYFYKINGFLLDESAFEVTGFVTKM